MARIYIMSNPAMPGLLKIGTTTRPLKARARELFVTGVPGPFNLLASWSCADDVAVKYERQIHELLKAYRCHPKREFFEISLTEARAQIEGFFRHKSDEEQEAAKARAREERAQQFSRDAKRLKGLIREELLEAVSGLTDELRENAESVCAALEARLSAGSVVSALHQVRRTKTNVKPVAHAGWRLHATYAYERAADGISFCTPNRVSIGTAQVSVRIDAILKKRLQQPHSSHGYFLASYNVVNGVLSTKHLGVNELNGWADRMIFPENLGAFLQGICGAEFADRWFDRFGASAVWASITEGNRCPVCSEGTLREHIGRPREEQILRCDARNGCNLHLPYIPTWKKTSLQHLDRFNVSEQSRLRFIPLAADKGNRRLTAEAPRTSMFPSLKWLIWLLALMAFLQVVARVLPH